jgi:hypothetical protein
MQPYDAIILDNVPAWDLSSTQMLSLQSYVRDLGCGLVMIGGENSYGPGGYRATPVEKRCPSRWTSATCSTSPAAPWR